MSLTNASRVSTHVAATVLENSFFMRNSRRGIVAETSDATAGGRVCLRTAELQALRVALQ